MDNNKTLTASSPASSAASSASTTQSPVTAILQAYPQFDSFLNSNGKIVRLLDPGQVISPPLPSMGASNGMFESAMRIYKTIVGLSQQCERLMGIVFGTVDPFLYPMDLPSFKGWMNNTEADGVLTCLQRYMECFLRLKAGEGMADVVIALYHLNIKVSPEENKTGTSVPLSDLLAPTQKALANKEYLSIVEILIQKLDDSRSVYKRLRFRLTVLVFAWMMATSPKDYTFLSKWFREKHIRGTADSWKAMFKCLDDYSWKESKQLLIRFLRDQETNASLLQALGIPPKESDKENKAPSTSGGTSTIISTKPEASRGVLSDSTNRTNNNRNTQTRTTQESQPPSTSSSSNRPTSTRTST